MYNHVVPQNIEHMYMCIYRNRKLKKLHLTVHKDLHSFRARARARATSIYMYIVHVLLHTVPLVVSVCFAMVSGRQSVDL